MSHDLTLPAGTVLGPNGMPVINASSYAGQDRLGPELECWMPNIEPPDEATLHDWEVSVGRLRQLIDENGITSGLVQSRLDHVIGPDLKLVAKPDYRALGLTADWAEEFAEQAQREFRNWGYDPGLRCHAGRTLDFPGMLRQGLRSKMSTGEIWATAEWIERAGWPYRTAIQPFDSELVSTPAGKADDERLRHGVVKDRYGAPVGAFIRQAHPGDHVSTVGSYRWRFVRNETPWGRTQLIHIFDQKRAGQSRGKSALIPAIKQIKMLEKWQSATMSAAIINSMYAAVIKSSVSHPELMQALGVGGQNPLSAYMAQSLKFHKGTNRIQYDGSKIAHLFPNEDLELLSAKQPVAAFEQFERAALRMIAAAGDTSYEQLSKDYTNTTYSSARASMLEAYKFIVSERQNTVIRLANIIYALMLEDAIYSGRIELPRNAPAFNEPGAKRAYCAARWIGPGRDQIDPVKDAQATKMELAMGLTSHEEEAARRGRDPDELIQAQASHFRKLIDAGVPEETARRVVWGADNVEYVDTDAEAMDTAERNERDAA
ncbi:MAG: phage portal protein [Wenzhouxiangella sp.]